jgi:hypothetical protein
MIAPPLQNPDEIHIVTIEITTIKKPFIREGRKAIPWYHPDFPSIHLLRLSAVPRILERIGGPEGTRTPDLLHAIETLSQLRYRPMFCIDAIAILVLANSTRRMSLT